MTYLRLCIPVFCLAIITSCDVLNKPKPQEHELQGTVSVKVTTKGGENVPIFLAAYPAGSEKPLATYRVKNGSVTGLILDANRDYEFRAFVDKDGNGKAGPNDPVGTLKGVKPDTDVHAAAQIVVLEVPEAGAAPTKAGAGSAAPPALDIDKFDAPKKTDAAAKRAVPEVPPSPSKN